MPQEVSGTGPGIWKNCQVKIGENRRSSPSLPESHVRRWKVPSTPLIPLSIDLVNFYLELQHKFFLETSSAVVISYRLAFLAIPSSTPFFIFISQACKMAAFPH
ncbi:hypothetical protein KSP39_PZI011674 [Platanthera zijinensis]|uniref:Uncharacterized protein n=1 Tax=Platanthera zijinensis TaxID=2320716 RepID=A0AAP0BGY0_9ASPA